MLFGLILHTMRFNKLDLHLRVAPGAMLALHSISRATEQLHISQSAMRNALARLRKYFADDLLVQVGRKMELTPRAETLRETVHGMLLRVDTTITAMPQCRNAAMPQCRNLCRRNLNAGSVSRCRTTPWSR